ncbi:hypothetical protein B0H17DRAFT_1150674 [Mycena rosella]|uniref:Uncharacterized protein n=1 Tax=Mycena rosella TaxID=1033263 RepID=A0AAD7BSV1_MYCRO|nr:hypothetical protein B0H17DRAFT_1150674 [Mycena rosella]
MTVADMTFSFILFNASPQVYTPRLLLLLSLGTPILIALYGIDIYIIVAIACSLLIAGRYILVSYKPPRADIELVMVVVEIGVFRTATVLISKDPVRRQSFAFLGGCKQVHPTVLGVPVLGVYSIVIMPLCTVVYTKVLSHVDSQFISGKTTILINTFTFLNEHFNESDCGWSIGRSGVGGVAMFRDKIFGLSVNCPSPGDQSWWDIKTLSISVNIARDLSGALVVWGISTASFSFAAGEVGSLQPDPNSSDDTAGLSVTRLTLLQYITYPTTYTQESVDTSAPNGVATFGGLWTFLTCAFALLFGANVLYSAFAPHRPIDIRRTPFQHFPRMMATLVEVEPYQTLMVIEPKHVITHLAAWTRPSRTYPGINKRFMLVQSNLFLHSYSRGPCKFLRCPVKSASWANGRRPLSALGVVHVFQRRTLVRHWHDEFSAIHSEGGLPGSESAGIVAFTRQRLVDLREDPRSVQRKDDPEAQTLPRPWQGGQVYKAPSSAAAFDRPQRMAKMIVGMESLY